MHKENLIKFINSVIKGDTASAREAFSPIIKHNSREYLGLPTNDVKPVNESVVLRMLQERFEDHDSPIKLDMDSVLVDGKKVGTIQIDYTDVETDGGINFIEEGGKFSKEFHSPEDMFRFLLQRYSRGSN